LGRKDKNKMRADVETNIRGKYGIKKVRLRKGGKTHGLGSLSN